MKLHVRNSAPADLPALERLYSGAFPDEDLVPLVRDLLSDPSVALSLVGVLDDKIVGHVVFTRCCLSHQSTPAALLGPLAVAPGRQQKGVGSHLVRFGIERIKSEKVQWLYVLGDPDYYQRFGFKAERLVKPPYPLRAEWSEAWQSIATSSDAVPDAVPDPVPDPVAAELQVPRQWQHVALWS